jgi:uncharacterized protein (DUF1778 family)
MPDDNPDEITATDSVEKPISFRATPEQRELIDAAIAATGLSRADVCRLAIERGAPLLIRQLTATES